MNILEFFIFNNLTVSFAAFIVIVSLLCKSIFLRPSHVNIASFSCVFLLSKIFISISSLVSRTIERDNNECAAIGVTVMVLLFEDTIGPFNDKLYPVEPVGVQITIPSPLYLFIVLLSTTTSIDTILENPSLEIIASFRHLSINLLFLKTFCIL